MPSPSDLALQFVRNKLLLGVLLATGFSVMPATAASLTAPAELPEDIYIKTPTQSFNSRFYYALHQGRIWIKPNRETTGKDEDWQPMGCDGLPCQADNPSFKIPQAISEISADADELTAIDNQGAFYVRTSAGPGLLSKDEWTMEHGFPKNAMKVPDYLKAKRAMVMGRRHYDVMWHEDMDKNVHHYGTMGTSSIYILSPTGYEIWFTDNGLPASFSNHICGPERGAFVAENLQVSAGTLFVINRAGEMYTQMNDFDLNGGTSMFINYTYTPQKFRPEDKGSDYNTHLTPWRIPTSEWTQQPAIPLQGKARSSSLITILQNGHGNAARELRVAGLNEQGQSGFWFKQIQAQDWQFKPAPIQIAPAKLTDQQQAAPRVAPQDLAYQGLAMGPDRSYTAYMELLDFNMQCSPARVRLTYGNQVHEFKLHTVDAWINLRRRDPGRDGTPQVMLATLDATPEQLKKLPEPYRSLFHQTYGIQLAATTDQVYIFKKKLGIIARLRRSSPIPSSLKTYNYHYRLPTATFTSAFFRDSNEKMLWLDDPELLLWDLDKLTVADIPRLEQLIEQNKSRFKDYQDGLNIIHKAGQAAWGEAVGTALLRNFYYSISAPLWIPNASAVCRTAPEILWSYYAVDDYLNEAARSHYNKMLKLLPARIERYQQRKAELEAEQARLNKLADHNAR